MYICETHTPSTRSTRRGFTKRIKKKKKGKKRKEKGKEKPHYITREKPEREEGMKRRIRQLVLRF